MQSSNLTEKDWDEFQGDRRRKCGALKTSEIMAENPLSKLSEPKDIEAQTDHKLLKTKGILKVAREKWKITVQEHFKW